MGYDMFGSNTTKLSDFELGFSSSKRLNASTGYYEAMIESSQQDMALMEAMLKVDAIEIQMRSGNSVNESAIIALREGAVDKIKTAIHKAWQWLIDKVRQLTDAFIRAIKKIIHNDLKVINKYEKDLMAHKDDIGTIEIDASLTYWDFNEDDVLVEMNIFDAPKFDREQTLKIAKAKTNKADITTEDCFEVLSASIDSSMRSVMKLVMFGKQIAPTKTTLTITVENIISRIKDLNNVLTKNEKDKAAALKYLAQEAKNAKTFLEKEDDDVVYVYNKLMTVYKKQVLSYYKIKDKTFEELLKYYRLALKEAIKKLHELKSPKSESLNMVTDFYFGEFDSILESTYSDDIDEESVIESLINKEFNSLEMLF